MLHWPLRGNILFIKYIPVNILKSYMRTVVEEMNIKTILAVMSTTDLVVINTSLSALLVIFLTCSVFICH